MGMPSRTASASVPFEVANATMSRSSPLSNISPMRRVARSPCCRCPVPASCPTAQRPHTPHGHALKATCGSVAGSTWDMLLPYVRLTEFLLRPPRRRPMGLIVTRPNQLRRQHVGLIGTLEDVPQRLAFPAPSTRKRTWRAALMSTGVKVTRHAHAPCDVLRHHPPFTFVQGRRARKQRGGMSIVAHAQTDEIEGRNRRCAEQSSQVLLVQAHATWAGSSSPAHAVDVTGRQRHMIATPRRPCNSYWPRRPAARSARR